MVWWTSEDLADFLLRRHSGGCSSTDAQLPAAVVERPAVDEPLVQGPGKKGGATRIAVRITSYRSRLCDPDNLSPKAVVDGLRYAGLIPDDRPQDISLEVSQEKVKKAEEKTVVEVEYL